jgi:hypothetical protein
MIMISSENVINLKNAVEAMSACMNATTADAARG